jgi:hypothetical protein
LRRIRNIAQQKAQSNLRQNTGLPATGIYYRNLLTFS